MEELKVGMWVRSPLGGEIDKIVKIRPKEQHPMMIETYALKKYNIWIDESEIKKASNNIIDLIEVGDYVNGEQVTYISKDGKRITLGDDSEWDMSIPNDLIFTVVTKEQFSSIEYKVGK